MSGRRAAAVALAAVVAAAVAVAASAPAAAHGGAPPAGPPAPDADRAGPPRVPVAYVANGGNNHIQVIDLVSGHTLRRIHAGAAPWRLRRSPDGRLLLAQHWYAGTTALIDTHDHEVRRVLPLRGPGEFRPGGDRLVSFDWPGSTLVAIDVESGAAIDRQVTELPRVYDLAFAPGGKTLYLAQFDPMRGAAAERYAYVVAYPLDAARPPVSLATGVSPAALARPARAPFLISADLGSNALTIANDLGASRALPSCPAPRKVELSPDGERMLVLCWRGGGHRESRIVSYRTDFSARPWPRVELERERSHAGGLVAGRFGPGGARFYALDQTARVLLEIDVARLEVERAFPVGDAAMDVEVLALPADARARLATQESDARRRLLALLRRRAVSRARGVGLAWTETVQPLPEGAPARAAPREERRVAWRPAGAQRADWQDGRSRLSHGGSTLTLERDGRFWIAPRQELLSVVLALPRLGVEEAVRALAGDEPGSPYLRTGLAVDVARERRVGGRLQFGFGGSAAGEIVPELWLDAETGRPVVLRDLRPSFARPRHDEASQPVRVETRFFEWAPAAGGAELPRRLERRTRDERWQVRISSVAAERGAAGERFDLRRLGGLGGPAGAAGAAPAQEAPDPLPGRPVPIAPHGLLREPLAPDARYATSPPTSGPHLPVLAPWGAHALPLAPQLQVHNLEAGGVALQYNCASPCPELVSQLEAIARERDRILVAPYPLMDARLALTAFGRIELLDAFDASHVERFIEAFAGERRPHAGGAVVRRALPPARRSASLAPQASRPARRPEEIP